MKKLITIISIIITGSIAYATEPINPLTGQPMKQAPVATAKTEGKSTTSPSMQNPYIPAPVYQSQYPQIPQQNSQQREDKPVKKELKPEERYVIDGIVNNNIVIIDQLNIDRYMQVRDMTMLDNACLVKYPSILCGESAKNALKNNESKEALTARVLVLTKEIAAEKARLVTTTATATRQNTELVNLKLKLASLDKTLSDKQKAELQLNVTKKTSDLEIVNIKKDYETQLAALKKTNADEAAKLKLIEPKLLQTTTELKNYRGETKDAMTDLSMLTSIIYNTSIGTDYNIPKIGKFKGVLHNNLIFAFVPIADKTKADTYMKSTLLRAYKSDKYVLYINNKKLVED